MLNRRSIRIWPLRRCTCHDFHVARPGGLNPSRQGAMTERPADTKQVARRVNYSPDGLQSIPAVGCCQSYFMRVRGSHNSSTKSSSNRSIYGYFKDFQTMCGISMVFEDERSGFDSRYRPRLMYAWVPRSCQGQVNIGIETVLYASKP